MTVPPDREREHLFVEANAGLLIDEVTARVAKEGASLDAGLLTLFGAAVGFARRHELETELDVMIELLRDGGLTIEEESAH